MVLGVIEGLSAVCVFLRWRAIRWVGVSIAALNSIAQLLFMPAYPLWALLLFGLDILVIYGLIAYGGPRE